MRRAWCLVPLLLGAALLAAAEPAAKAPRGRSAAAKLFRARCASCHDPSRVFHRRASASQWRATVDRMRRMPHSGITKADADKIVQYLVDLGGKRPAALGGKPKRLGGRRAYGKEWLAVLETARVNDGEVSLGGRDYTARVAGNEVTLWHTKGKPFVVSLDPAGRAGRTQRVDSWKVGRKTYAVHLIFYERIGDQARLGLALRVEK